ncbi:MAG: Ldh family oxidoreductase [Deltaproteobacteria bacterium]|jgi:LDH2 family malate/lactate/ureidoglycolate dehydrogenase|nr:Ldh family oxidoreductase [Deltaproteobacteria bacterium]
MSSDINYVELLAMTAAILEKGFSYNGAEAITTARVLVEADARGIPSHGVSRLNFYKMNLKDGHTHPGNEPKITWETPSSIVVDGNGGVGPYVAEFAVRKVIEKAHRTGVCFASVRNSNHYGIAGYWAELMAKEDMIGLAFTNTYIAGVPTFGRFRILGTNPIAAAIPEAKGKIFLLDLATTTVTHGKVELYDRRQKPMPPGWVVDENGNEITDASAFEKTFYQTNYGGHLFLGGAGEESGGHKGYGLALLVEILCSGLSMGACSLLTYPTVGNGGITHFFGAFKMDLFGKPREIKAHIGGILTNIRESAKAIGQNRIYIHGEKESEAREKALEEGIYLDKATRIMLSDFCRKYRVDEIEGLVDDV